MMPCLDATVTNPLTTSLRDLNVPQRVKNVATNHFRRDSEDRSIHTTEYSRVDLTGARPARASNLHESRIH